jgi:protein ImuB
VEGNGWSVPDGPPISFHLGGQAVRIRRWSGPERIESGWWRGASARRDYYRVEIEAGLRYWIFRRLQDGAWFLHGEFS